MRSLIRTLLAGLVLALSASTMRVALAQDAPPVSAAVVMALDYSSSMTLPERQWQAGGLAAVFADPSIEERIDATWRGAVAVTVMRFAGAPEPPFIPWTVLRSGDGSVAAFVAALEAEAAAPRPAGGSTNLAAAILAGTGLLTAWPDSDRFVIDVQTDGYQGEGPTNVTMIAALETARDAAGMRGVIINVLVMGDPESVGTPLVDYHWRHTATGTVWDARDHDNYLKALQSKILDEMF